MTEKTGVIGGLDLPEKAQHSRERGREWERERCDHEKTKGCSGVFQLRLNSAIQSSSKLCRFKAVHHTLSAWFVAP